MHADPTGTLAVPICDQLASHVVTPRAGHKSKADALYQRVPAKQRKPVLEYIRRYFAYEPPVRTLDAIPCESCDETFTPSRADARYCSAKCRKRGTRAK